MRNLLIVNADDWGIDEPTTEAALLCFDAGAVTSVSAMVFMAGSQAGSRLALARGVPAGLHINLTEPFNAAADGAARARQARIAEYFAGPARRRWGPNSRLFAEIERAIGEQFEEFHRLYGREPTHVDGHEHIHQSLGVLAARTIPSGTRMRPSFERRMNWAANMWRRRGRASVLHMTAVFTPLLRLLGRRDLLCGPRAAEALSP